LKTFDCRFDFAAERPSSIQAVAKKCLLADLKEGRVNVCLASSVLRQDHFIEHWLRALPWRPATRRQNRSITALCDMAPAPERGMGSFQKGALFE